MITVNFLPKNLRKQEKKIALPSHALLLRIFALLIALHLLLLTVAAYKAVQILILKGQWAKLEFNSKDSLAFKKEIQDLESKIRMVEAQATRQTSFTEIFSSLNAAVPKGLWLERFTFSEQGLIIQGSVVSSDQNEMTVIGKFLQDIRESKSFAGLFAKIELTSVQRRTIKNFDVVDFVITGDLKK